MYLEVTIAGAISLLYFQLPLLLFIVLLSVTLLMLNVAILTTNASFVFLFNEYVKNLLYLIPE